MRTITRVTWALFLLAGAATAAEPEPIKFTKPPVVTKDGAKTKIEFAVSRRTDVEVAILDAKGKVVRHLAAGVVGAGNPPPAPLKAGLSQSLEWDGKDDNGKQIDGEPPATAKPPGEARLKLRVRAGMGVAFGRIIGGSPYTGTGESIALDEKGNLYVMMQIYNGHSDAGIITRHVRMFDRDGKYVKTLLPYPASTPPAKAAGMKLLDSGDPGLTPANMGSMYPCFFAFGESMHHRVLGGALLFLHGKNRAHKNAGIIAFKLDGSNKIEKRRLMWSKKVPLSGYIKAQLAFSGDGRYAYISSVDATGYNDKTAEAASTRGFPVGRIYRQDLKAGKDPESFYDLKMPEWEDKKFWVPNAWRKKTAAAGIDVGPKGNVYVGDMVNHRVVEISPEGKKLSSVSVPWPERVHVHPKTGDIYVVSYKVNRAFVSRRGPATIYKISGRGKSAKVAAKLKLPAKLKQTGIVSAFDASGKNPAFWLTGGSALIKVEDRGDSFAIVKENILNPPGAISFLTYMDVDTEAELVYVTSARREMWRYNGETGKGGRLKGMKATDMAIGPGGMIYTYADKGGYSGPLGRYTRDLKPAPFKATGKHQFGKVWGRWGKQSAVGGLDVDWRGRSYVIWGQNRGHVRVYDETGKRMDLPRKGNVYSMNNHVIAKDEPILIDGLSGYGLCIRVDLAGNVYVGQRARPKGHVPPRGFEKDPGYKNMVGAIYKFGPEGGALKYAHAGVSSAEGVKAIYPGLSPISGWMDGSVCACTRPRFDVDGFGRLYIPDAVTFKVHVRDNAGNPIVRFGGYANFDSQGPESKCPTPKVPMAWPVCAAASDRYIYIGDNMNHRVVRADKTWAVETSCAIE
jgi:hypothetical protein